VGKRVGGDGSRGEFVKIQRGVEGEHGDGPYCFGTLKSICAGGWEIVKKGDVAPHKGVG
jgi:hypothetical protein